MTESDQIDMLCIRLAQLERRNADLIEANNRYLERARAAEAKLAIDPVKMLAARLDHVDNRVLAIAGGFARLVQWLADGAAIMEPKPFHPDCEEGDYD